MKKKLSILVVVVAVIYGLAAVGPAVGPTALAEEKDKDTALLEAIGEITSELQEVNSTLKYMVSEPEEPEVIEWIGQVESGLTLASLQEMSEDISAASGGRLVLDVRASGDICSRQDEFDAVNQGVLDFAVTAPDFWTEKFPAASLFSTRCGGMSPMEKYLWLISGGGAGLAQEMVDAYDVYIVPGGGQMGTPETFLSSNNTIVTVGDLAGLKVRAWGDSWCILANMGAQTVLMPGNEIYKAMEDGMIDAFEFVSPCLDLTMSFHEVAEYVYLSECRVPHYYNPFIVNEDSWAALPDDLRVLVEKMAREQVTKYYAELCQCDMEALVEFQVYGCTVERLSQEVEDAFLAEASAYYDDKAIEYGGLYAEVLASQREFQAAFRGIWPRP